MREGLLAASTAVGLEAMSELMEAEVTDLAGPKGRHDPARRHTRHGGENGSVTLGGRRVAVRRPRVRSVGDDEHEVPLGSYATFASADLLAEGHRRTDARGHLHPPLPGRDRTRRRRRR